MLSGLMRHAKQEMQRRNPWALYHCRGFLPAICPRCSKEPSMTHVQRLKYSLLIILVVLGLMLGLSHLQKQGTISEQTFQMLAIAIAVVVVVINGILRRKVKP